MRCIAVCLALVLCACTAPTPSASAPAPGSEARRTEPSAAPAAAPAASAPTSAASTLAPPSVPAQFHGEWNETIEHCGTALNDSRLRIGAGELQYHESRGPIRAAVARGRDELALIVELSGEGETWLTTGHFRLSPDGNELTSVGSEGAPLVRKRCPAAAEQ